MPLLLAIEPDARQAASLTTLVSAHLTADLVVATSAAEALDALRQRRPDLLLIASSLSEADQAELTAALVTGNARPDVPTLAVPHLAGDATASRKARDLLARLRRPRARRRSEAGDPAAFAAQITECLAMADTVRRACPHAPTGAATRSRGEGPASAQVFQVIVESGLANEPVVELPPAGELWAQLAPGYPARMAPLEGPSMSPTAPHATTRDERAGLESAEAAGAPLRLVRAPTRADRPMQDEWGLYDPQQCGFAALLLRLEELADDERREQDGGDRSAIMRP